MKRLQNEIPIMEIEETTQLMVHNVPMEIKRDFKSACAKNNITMHDCIIELMIEYTKREIDPIYDFV